LVFGDKSLIITTSDGKVGSYSERGNWQTLEYGIHGYVVRTEGNMEVFAILKGISFSVDPNVSGSSFLYAFIVDNTSEGLKSYGYLLNMSGKEEYNYNIHIDNLTKGISIESSNASIKTELTVMHTDAEGHWYVFNATDIPVNEGNTAEFEVKSWSSLNSSSEPAVALALYKPGENQPFKTYELTNGMDVLESTSGGSLLLPISIVIIIIGAIGLSFAVWRRREQLKNPPINEQYSQPRQDYQQPQQYQNYPQYPQAPQQPPKPPSPPEK